MIHSLHPRSSIYLSLVLATGLVVACGPHTASPDASPAEQPASDSAAAAPAAEADSAGSEDFKNNIKWSTASEVENAGFNVYRGDSAEGPFERLNEELIEGAYTTDEPSYYSFVDRDIDPYRSYFYYVESVSLAGVREHFTPVIEAKPKLPKTDG